ncbi:hypothetical protein FW774_17255 [Pedobacter sp. BS3]|uniref:hypothetical protein n=1 Tax=Pedobacter sp. BS3 TaxID=2567937 RepID=UPI0011EF2033|nr:hypothetical protein [Pedobacter sp. BS3]TZF81804.1 hypothetical protein FW774_17255 [Pedobacter sp. BS3]
MKQHKKLDLHTLVVVMMSLNGWNLMPRKHNELLMHRIITNNKFASRQAYQEYQFELVESIGRTFEAGPLRCVHMDIHIDDVF